jgi:hypothetical protein
MIIPRPLIIIYSLIFVPELLNNRRLYKRPIVILIILSYILLTLIYKPFRAWLIGGSNGNVDLNELLRELVL